MSDDENPSAKHFVAMSVFGLERSQTTAANAYDHAINLVDTTQPKPEPEQQSLDGSGSEELTPASRSDSGTLLNRQWTKSHLRKELARRKYAKWQHGREDDSGAFTDSGAESSASVAEETRTNHDERSEQENTRTGRLRDRLPFRAKKRASKVKKEPDSFIDVLYENQRGSFFFGIPLYSSKSLLNLDPSGWQNSTFQDSAVNVTNAQLPDPSWSWAWRTWYVDMSHDVDEEGWEYSFSFNNLYAWHGSHPWFHSFVRRRRWLRKRVRSRAHEEQGKRGNLKNAHMLTADYFTIHAAKRSRSRGSSADRTTLNRSSNTNGHGFDNEDEEEIGEIGNLSALLAAFKRARVDREKITAVKIFLDQGGDELFYLADAIPDIMADFVHQTSRRQLQSHLLQVLDEATRQKANNNGDQEKEEAVQRKIDNLLKVVHAAGVHVNDLDYWSDLRTRATSSETGVTNQTHALDATEPATVASSGPHSHSDDDEPSVRDEIKGIPNDAHISQEPRIGPTTAEKGKGKA